MLRTNWTVPLLGLQPREQEGVDEPTAPIAPAGQDPFHVSGQRGRFRDGLAVQVADIGHVRIELAGGEPVGPVVRVAVAEL